MNHFDTDKRDFAKHFVKYGVIPTDKDLPYEASEESAMGGYVHPMKDMEKMNAVSEKRLRSIVRESIRKVLKEGTTDEAVLEKLDSLKGELGADYMLDCILNWLGEDQLATIVRWFESEGY